MYMEGKNGRCGPREKGLAGPDTLSGKFSLEFAESVNCIFTGAVLNLYLFHPLDARKEICND